MKGELIDLAVGMDGRQRLTIALDGDARGQYDELHGKPVTVELKLWHKRRSIDANAYMWILADKLAAALNLTKEEVYREAIRNIGGVSEIVCVRNEAVQRLCEGWERNGIGWQTDTFPSKIPGCTNVILYYGSSCYDSKQMAVLIDLLVRECTALGIETLPPDELAALEASWSQ